MAFPYDDLTGNPLQAIALAGLGRQRGPAVPDLPPEEQNSLLGDLLEKSVGGLGYVGKVLDKTFGARAVRGILGGHPEEALSILPLSDTLGLTDERNVVKGTDLLAKAGLITPGDTSWQNELAGFGVELLTDPSTYIGLGPLTRAGTLAKKAGALPRGLASGMRGFDVAESALKPTLSAGQTARDALRAGQTLLPEALEQAGVKTGEPLRALFGFGLPFSEPVFTVGTGPTAQRIGRAVDTVAGAVGASAPIRALKAAFSPDVQGTFTKEGQQLASEFYTPLLREYTRSGNEQALKFIQDLQPQLQADPDRVMQAVRLAAEGYQGDALARAVAGKLSAPEALKVVQTGSDMGSAIQQFRKLERERGLTTGEWESMLSDYFTRTKNPIPRKPGESIASYLVRIGREFSTTHGSQFERNAMFDVPGGTTKINEWVTDPNVHALVQQARQSGNSLPLEQFFRQELTGSPALSASENINEQAAQLARWIQKLPDQHWQQQLPFFRQDPFADFQLRSERSAKARASADTIYEGIKRYASDITGLVASGETDFVPVTDLLTKLKLTANEQGVRTGRELAAKALGVNNLNALKDYALPGDVARDILRLGQAWKTPRELTPILQAWDWAANLFRTWVTAPFAAFHIRNLLSGMFNMWRDSAFSPSAMREAYNVIRGGTLDAPIPQLGRTVDESRDALVRAAAADRVAFTHSSGRAADTAPELATAVAQRLPQLGGTGNSLLGDIFEGMKRALPKSWEEANPFNIAGVNRLDDTNSFIREMRKVQATLDDWLQLSHYIAKLRQGFDPQTAGLAVKKYHNDYSALTDTERFILRRIFPWYSFSRRTLPPLLEDLATKPAKIAAGVRAATGMREPFEFVPGYIAEQASVPIPGAPEGQQRYLSSFGLPFEDESIKALGNFAHGDVTRGLQTILGMTQPALKAPLEQAFGTQLFSGRKLEDLRALNAIEGTGLFNEEDARKLSQLIANTPASRTFTTLDKLLDERKTTVPTLLNVLSGVHIQDVDADRNRNIAAKALLEELLRGQPGVRVHEDVYVPQDKLGLLDPLELKLYQAYRTADKAVQKRAREKAAQR